jgi:hypothetical protein
MMWGQNVWLNPNAIQKLEQGRGKIALGRTPHPAHIPIEGECSWQAIGAQEMDHCVKGRFRMKILMDLSREQTGRTCIHKIADFHQMLSLPRWRCGVSAHRCCKSTWTSCSKSCCGKGERLLSSSRSMSPAWSRICQTVRVECGRRRPRSGNVSSRPR